jgi:hypothetical protein
MKAPLLPANGAFNFSTAFLLFLVATLPIFSCLSWVLSGFLFDSMDSMFFGWDSDLFKWVPTSVDIKIVTLARYLFILFQVYLTLLVIVVVYRFRKNIDRKIRGFGTKPTLICVGALGFTGLLTLGCYGFHLTNLVYISLGFSIFGVGAIGLYALLRSRTPTRIDLLFAAGSIILGLVPLCLALGVRPFHVPNEFISLPGETVLQTGQVVDNITFINSRTLEGMWIPDPRKMEGDSKTLIVQLDAELARKSPEAIESFANKLPSKFWYDKATGGMEIHGFLSSSAFHFLKLFITDPAEHLKLEQKFSEDAILTSQLENRKYTREELDFLHINSLELKRQLVLGRFFYHHTFLYMPILEGVLEGTVKTASQYGRGYTEIFSAALKLFPEYIRFNAYLVLLYGGYLAYLLIILTVAWRMRISLWGLIFVGATTILAYLATEIETTRLGVGLAPWRHLFDVWMFYLLFRYIHKRKLLVGMTLLALTGFSVYWSREMGLFAAMGVVMGLFVNALWVRTGTHRLLLGTCLLVTAACWFFGDTQAIRNFTIVLFGFSTPKLPNGFVQLWTGVIAFSMAFWWRYRPAKANDPRYPDWIFMCASIVYVAASAMYLFFYPRPHHLAPMIPSIGLAFAVGYRYFSDRAAGPATVLAKVGVAGSLCLLVVLGITRIAEVWSEHQTFRKHVVHHWKFPNGYMISTGQPQLLEESIDLIRSYELRSSVNILSPWEIVLLPFAGKYKTGSISLSFDSLFAEGEIEYLAKSILNSPSDFLFMDTRIAQGRYEFNLGEFAYMQDRVEASEKLNDAKASLRRVFRLIQPCYNLEKRGPLISVYKRNPLARWNSSRCGVSTDLTSGMDLSKFAKDASRN